MLLMGFCDPYDHVVDTEGPLGSLVILFMHLYKKYEYDPLDGTLRVP